MMIQPREREEGICVARHSTTGEAEEGSRNGLWAEYLPLVVRCRKSRPARAKKVT